MAQIQEQTVVIHLTKLLKNTDKRVVSIMPASIRETIEQLVSELVNDPTVVVEVTDDTVVMDEDD